MSFDIDKLMLGDKIGVAFAPDEAIKLICNPHLKACFFNEMIGLIPEFLFYVGTIIFFQLSAFITGSTVEWGMLLIFFGFVSLISLVRSIWTILKLRTTVYLITNISVVIYQDFYSTSTKVINIKDIKIKESKKTIADKRFKTGTVKIFTGETKEDDGRMEKVYDDLRSIVESEKVYALLEINGSKVAD